jgi:hypothetical protein
MGRIWAAISRPFTRSEPINPDEIWGIHVSAEHLSQRAFSGNQHDVALRNTVKHLEKMGSNKLRDSLRFALGIEELLLRGKKAEASEQLKASVQKLDDKNPSLFFATGSRGHATMMEIKFTGKTDDRGQRLFSVIHYNTGSGIRYHHSRISEGKPQYQTSYEIQDVPEDRLCGQESKFFTEVFNAKEQKAGVEHLYKDILPLLGGHLAEPSQDRRLWSHGQLGGSCTASGIVALLRAHMEGEEARKFKDSIRCEMLLKMYEKVQIGKRSSRTITVILEITKKLQRGSISPSLSTELKRTTQLLENGSIAEPPEEESKGDDQGKAEGEVNERDAEAALAVARSSKSPEKGTRGTVSALSQAFSMLKKEAVLSTERQRAIEELILQANDAAKENLPPKDLKQLQGLVSEMCTFLKKEQILSKNQITLYTAMMSLIRKVFTQNPEIKLPEEFEEGFNRIWNQYNSMSKREETVTVLEEITDIIPGIAEQKTPEVSPQRAFTMRHLAATATTGERLSLDQFSNEEEAIMAAQELLNRWTEFQEKQGSTETEKSKYSPRQIVSTLVKELKGQVNTLQRKMGLTKGPFSPEAIISSLIANPHVQLETLQKRIGIQDIEENAKIAAALKKRFQKCLGDTPSPEKMRQYDSEFETHFRYAYDNFGLSWYDAQVYAHMCTQTKLAQGTEDLSKLPRDIALTQAKTQWMIPQRRGETLTVLFQNPNLSIKDLHEFIRTRRPSDINEAGYMAQDGLKTRLENDAKSTLALSEEEVLVYKTQYNIYLKKAQKSYVPWFEASLYADACAKAYLSKMKEAESIPKEDTEAQQFQQEIAETYARSYSDSCLSQLEVYIKGGHAVDFVTINHNASRNADKGIQGKYKESTNPSVQNAVKMRLQTTAKTSLALSPEEEKEYQAQYTKYLNEASKRRVSWFAANMYADTCSRKYILKMREARRGGKAHEDVETEMANEYVKIYSARLLEQVSLMEFLGTSTDFDRCDRAFSEEAEKQIQTKYESEYF